MENKTFKLNTPVAIEPGEYTPEEIIAKLTEIIAKRKPKRETGEVHYRVGIDSIIYNRPSTEAAVHKPKYEIGQRYWYATSDFQPYLRTFRDKELDHPLIAQGRDFPTREEADAWIKSPDNFFAQREMFVQLRNDAAGHPDLATKEDWRNEKKEKFGPLFEYPNGWAIEGWYTICPNNLPHFCTRIAAAEFYSTRWGLVKTATGIGGGE